MKHIERGLFNQENLVNSNLHLKVETQPSKLPQYLLTPHHFFGNLYEGIDLSDDDGLERGQFIYSSFGHKSKTKIFKGKPNSIGGELHISLEKDLYNSIPSPLQPTILTFWHTHPLGKTDPSTQDILSMFGKKKNIFYVIGSPNYPNSLYIHTMKSRSYLKDNDYSLMTLKKMLSHNENYFKMDSSQRIRFIKSLGFGVYHQVKHKSKTDYLWKKSR